MAYKRAKSCVSCQQPLNGNRKGNTHPTRKCRHATSPATTLKKAKAAMSAWRKKVN